MSLKLRSHLSLALLSLIALSCDKSARKPPIAMSPEVDFPLSAGAPTEPLRATSRPEESEPTAGAWRTILVASPGAITAPPPPSGKPAALEAKEVGRLVAGRTERDLRAIAWWEGGAVRRWNSIARGVASSEQLNSCQGARMLALLAVAQYDALVTVWHHKYRYRRLSPSASGAVAAASTSERYSYPSEDAAVAAASASVLSYVAGSEKKFFWRNAEEHRDSRLQAGAIYPSDAKAGWEIGLAAAERVKDWGARDGARTAHWGVVPQEKGKWWEARQILPGWGRVRPWLIDSVEDFRAPKPPPPGSAAFRAAVREVREIADARSAEQLITAQYWDLGVGAISVPGMWDQIGIQAMKRAGFSEPRIARALALANMAMMDASIVCWETKYHYRVRRPKMEDDGIATVMEVPPHPSYTSGHAAFSGAAAAVFGYALPEKAEWFDKLAEQAAMSRLYGGIHYRFDDDEGLKQGRAVAAVAIARGRKDGCPPPAGAAGTGL